MSLIARENFTLLYYIYLNVVVFNSVIKYFKIYMKIEKFNFVSASLFHYYELYLIEEY